MYKNIDLSYILSNFNIKNYKIKKIKEKTSKKSRIIYKITTFDKSFCLKQTYFNVQKILFIYSYLEWLKLYKFEVPYFIKSINNKPFTLYNNKIYTLSNWISGNKLLYNNLDDCIRAIKIISKIHFHLNKIDFIKYSVPTINLVNIKNKFIKYIQDLHKLHEIAKLKNDKFSKIFLSNFYNSLYLANNAYRYSLITNFKNLNISLCHGDYVNKNIIINDKSVIPIDFDRCCINYSIYDFGYFLKRYLKHSFDSWNIKNTLTLLNYYNSNNPIFIDEYFYLLSYLSFPYKFLKISKLYFHSNHILTNKEIENYENNLIKSCNDFDKHLLFIKNFEQYISSKFNMKINKS
ncbi:phosphotransferase [Candidatus Arthromitus sp. SFB-rat-Yit]|uniref:phosphotransferase n=1 Tax=Candidatus Arthromitus sp. SFB-rat-Yit TaxID=1041504 RepID=UPI000227A556|nr:phosphotransferase [Candidatus Arthromitus sp. SFB-rat-Yit]BAK81002.1 putative spore coat protein [Candidatus Arthromitus sp. SFB-rat-Yit]